MKPVLVDFKKISDVVDNDVVKKIVYDEFAKKLMLIRLLVLAI